MPYIRRIARGCVPALALALLSSHAAAQHERHGSSELVKRAGNVVVTLQLPLDGLAAARDTQITVRVSRAQGGAPVERAAVAATLAMPAMPGMGMQPPTAAPGSAPGAYTISLRFPHAGAYRLDLRITPQGEPAVTVSFDLNVQGTHGMAGMHIMSPFAGIPMSREASGTSWQPDSSPMHGEHRMIGPWMLMQHYAIFLDYDNQSGPRGDDQFNSINWYMAMASRPIGKGELMLRGMFSLEPATVTPRGYPLLFQTGESYGGKPLVDRQHPHDFFMEVAARYRYPLDPKTVLSLYLAPSGEPALGPPAFMHRVSAADMPMSPITHHWMDSTHIAFGVLTGGLSRGNAQLEGSIFTGREPDEHRWNFDPIHLDSYSGRLTFNPGPNWSLQGSYGYLKSPESLRPDEDVRRTTLSASYNQPRADSGNWAGTLAWGRNREHGDNSDAFLFETSLNLANRNTLFGRIERVDKLGEELAITPADRKFGITELTFGCLHELTPGRAYNVGVGASITFNWKPSDLDPLYGRSPTGFWLFLRLRPAAMGHM